MIFGNELFGGLKLIEQKIFKDERGYFTETYNKERYNKDLYDVNFVQDNESCSKKFVIRGLHYQNPPETQGKLVRVIKGSVIDFVLDYRRYCPHYGKMLFVYLTPGMQFFVPRGFAHGFISLEDDTIFAYKCDNFYCKEAEAGYNILDEKLGIIEKLSKFLDETNICKDFSKEKLIFSEKDLMHPNFSEVQ
jgi:dTDP-4-dehydrorhamnose 3,5-epimerase